MIKTTLILLLSLFSAALYAQEPTCYTTKNGLPSNNVYDIEQDANGFMWFATDRGIVKFDGENFKLFTIRDGLPNNDILFLETDKQGSIYYATKSNYQGYIKNDIVYKYGVPDSYVVNPINFHSNNKRVWLSCGRGFLTVKNNQLINELDSKLNHKGVLFEKKRNYFNNHTTVYNPQAKEFYILEKELIVIDSLYKQLYNLPINNTKWLQIDKTTPIKHNKLLPNNTFWYGMPFGMLFFNFESKALKTIDFKILIGEENVSNIYSVKAFDNEIHISIPNYLLVFDYEYKLTRKYHFSNQNRNSKNYQDVDGNIWQASLKNGIKFIPNSNIGNNAFLSSKVQKIEKIDKILYVGVAYDGFYEYNITSNSSKKSMPISSDALVYDIKKDSISQVDYFISSKESYKNFNDQTSWVSYFSQTFTDSSLTEYDLVSNFKDILTFNESEYSIMELGLHNNQNSLNEIFFQVSKSGLEKMIVFKDALYVSGNDGLHVFNNENDLNKPMINNELLSFPINYLTKNKTHIIVGTDGRGVYYYNNKELVYLKHTDGLIVQKIIEKNSVIWLATNEGVKKVSLDKKNLANSKITDAFYESDGLLQNNANDIYIKDSLLLVASDIGLAKINLNNKIYKQLPKLYFKTEKDTLHFENSKRDNITVSFSTLDFVNQEHLQYQYRLLPQKKEWVSINTKILNFSNLTPKLYTLEVQVSDQHNNTSIIKQYLNIIPNWWQTKSAKFGFGILSLLLFLSLIKLLQERIRRKEKGKLEQTKRYVNLELQALRSQMNPHFVHNSLNAIQYFVQRNEVELSENYLSKFSKLIRLFFEYSRRQNIFIKEEIELLTNYLEIEKLRFEEKLEFKISVDDAIDTEEQNIPSMILQPIVENAVNHGLFHKQEKGLVSVVFKYINDNEYIVIVKDDGVGINKADSIFKRSSKTYQSNSSSVLKERLDLLNQNKEWEIDYKLQDRSEIESKKTGTIVTITFNKP